MGLKTLNLREEDSKILPKVKKKKAQKQKNKAKEEFLFRKQKYVASGAYPTKGGCFFGWILDLKLARKLDFGPPKQIIWPLNSFWKGPHLKKHLSR